MKDQGAMMRLSLYILFTILLHPLWLQADILTGRILSIDREKGEMVLVPGNCKQCPLNETKENTTEHVGSGVSPPVPVIISAGHIPFFAKPDSFVRAWGEFSKESDTHFMAHRIAGPGWRHSEPDSTGVRSRLRKRCLKNDTHHPPGPWPHDLPPQEQTRPAR